MDAAAVLFTGIVLYALGVLTGVLVTRAVVGVERLARNVKKLADEMDSDACRKD